MSLTSRLSSLCQVSRIGEQLVEYTREILRALGAAPVGPTFIATDNKANMLVAHDAGASAHSRHFLRRYVVLQQRMRSGSVEVGHIPDADMPADYLTKWVNADKLRKSVAYATNARARVA